MNEMEGLLDKSTKKNRILTVRTDGLQHELTQDGRTRLKTRKKIDGNIKRMIQLANCVAYILCSQLN